MLRHLVVTTPVKRHLPAAVNNFLSAGSQDKQYSTNAKFAHLKRKKLDYARSRELAGYIRQAFYPPGASKDKAYCDSTRGDVDLASCDYIGLAKDPELTKIETDLISKYGHITQNRSGAYPRNPNGGIRKFERAMCEWMHGENAFVANTGMEANVDLLQTLEAAYPKMPLYFDKYAHATLPMGARVAGRMDYSFFNHNDVNDLHRLIKQNGPGIIAIDSIYSAMGTVAPLEDIVELAHMNDCILIVDEAHAVGVDGPEGKGLVVEKNLEDYVHFRTTSLGKSFGLAGGLVMTNKDSNVEEITELLNFCSDMCIFSIAPQDWWGERLLKTLERVKAEEWRREELHAKTKFFREGVYNLGYKGHFVKNTQTHVIPCVVGKVDFAQQLYHKFVEQGFYPSPHYYPASPRNKSVLRFTVCQFLEYEQLQRVLDFMEEIKDFAKPWEWPDYEKEVHGIGFELEHAN